MSKVTFQNFLKLLNKDLQTPNYNLDHEVLHEFKGFPFIEIGADTQTESENFGIYVAFIYNEIHKDFFTELFDKWPLLTYHLKSYLESLFSENTNNDASSIMINFNTNHGATQEESLWEITLEVTDYLS